VKKGGCMPFISNLSMLMKERGITYEELQFLSKVAPDTIARARDERISTCKLFTLEKLAVALDVDVHNLFEYVKVNKM
jgi:Predicted transcriptional regulator